MPVVISSREVSSFTLRKDGFVSGSMEHSAFKRARGSSKQYFGKQKSDKEHELQEGSFNEYDPFNEDSYLESMDESIELLGDLETPEYGGQVPPLDESGIPTPLEPPPAPDAPLIPDVPPPLPSEPFVLPTSDSVSHRTKPRVDLG